MVLKLRLGVPLVVVTGRRYRENDGVLVKSCCLIWITVIRGEFSSWTFIDLHFYGIWLFSVYITLQQPCFWSIPLRRLIMSWAQLGAARRGTGTHSKITECLERHVSGSSGGYDLPDPGMEATSLVSPALAGGFFTTSATWEAPDILKIWTNGFPNGK